jgi:hypothetical protein
LKDEVTREEMNVSQNRNRGTSLNVTKKRGTLQSNGNSPGAKKQQTGLYMQNVITSPLLNFSNYPTSILKRLSTRVSTAERNKRRVPANALSLLEHQQTDHLSENVEAVVATERANPLEEVKAPEPIGKSNSDILTHIQKQAP